MDQIELLQGIVKETPSKIIFLIVDGIGGLPDSGEGLTELESAKIPNLNNLASRSSLGLITPIIPGVTPGSGPAHLALFGYDPLKYQIGRGALSAAGVGFKQMKGDLAARINFATIDREGKITDRRAGRIPTELAATLCTELSKIELPGTQLFVLPEKEHRAVVIFRSSGLSDQLTDSDPQATGIPPLEVKPLKPEAQGSAELVDLFIGKARKILSSQERANMILLRGFALRPNIPSLGELYKLKPLAICVYPMYKGLAHLVGMEVLEGLNTMEEEFKALRENYQNYTFFYLHIKKTDSYGEDGNFKGKVKVIEEVDHFIPELLSLNPDCLVITGDHSTPALLKSHSWHPVPFLLYSPYARQDKAPAFTERYCVGGSLGVFNAQYALSLALGHALKLEKFGA